MTNLRTHESMPAGAVRTEWERLVDEDPHATIFHSPRYLDLWHRTLAPGTPIRIHTLHREGRIVGVIPDANDLQGSPLGPEEIRRFMGGTDVTDYLGPISRLEDRTDVANAYVENLAADVDWDEFVAGGLARSSSWPDVFRQAVANHDLLVLHDHAEAVCPQVDLSDGYEAYLSSLPGKQRQELTRKTRKLARDAGELSLVQVPAEEVAPQMDAFLDQAAESFPDKSGFFQRDDMHEWFKALAEEFAGDGVFQLHRLDVGGIPAASTVSFRYGKTWGLYNSAYDPSLGSLAPGMVMVSLLIERAAEEGCTTFDFLRGDEAYKYRFGAVDEDLDCLTIVRQS